MDLERSDEDKANIGALYKSLHPVFKCPFEAIYLYSGHRSKFDLGLVLDCTRVASLTGHDSTNW